MIVEVKLDKCWHFGMAAKNVSAVLNLLHRSIVPWNKELTPPLCNSVVTASGVLGSVLGILRLEGCRPAGGDFEKSSYGD